MPGVSNYDYYLPCRMTPNWFAKRGSLETSDDEADEDSSAREAR